MFGIKRWDPASRAGLEAPTSAPASHIDLNAKIAEKRGRKRKRLQDDEEVPRALPATSLVLPNSVTPAHASPLAATPADPTPTAGSAAQSESRRAKARVSFGYTGGNAVPLPTEPVAKTKAKQRYLRKKRERRKARDRSSGSASGGLDASPQVDVPGPGDDRTASAPKEGLLSEKRIASRRLRSPQDEESTGAGPPLRSRNRPKNLDDALRRAQLHASVTSKRDSHKDLPPSATHPGALPSFPEPRRPEAPDVALLSRLARGLGDEDDEDEAQEIRIDPGSAADVDVLAAPIGPGPRLLSSRTVDRLKEIGISTLFAGMWTSSASRFKLRADFRQACSSVCCRASTPRPGGSGMPRLLSVLDRSSPRCLHHRSDRVWEDSELRDTHRRGAPSLTHAT